MATVNAVLRHLNLVDKTSHCKDTSLVECANEVNKFIAEGYQVEKVGVIGFQPRLTQFISKSYKVRVSDMDADNIGKERFGLKIEPNENNPDIYNWADLLFVTGTVFVNDSYKELLQLDKPVVFYGVTAAAPVYLLNLKRYCPYGT